MDLQNITLASLADGACEEQFQAALRRVLENLDDPNTPWKGKRQIVLKIDFESDEERKTSHVSVACTTKLAAARPSTSVLFIGRRNGEMVAVEAYKQETMFDDQRGRLLELPRGDRPETE